MEMQTKHGQQIVEQSRELMQIIGISKEELFWFRIEMGCSFLERYFDRDEVLKIVTETNFWDLYIRDWILGDAEITPFDLDVNRHYYENGEWHEQSKVDRYKKLKLQFWDEEKFLWTFEQFCE